MRPLLLIACLLPACTAARRTTISPEGAVEIVNGGQMGGRYTLVYTRSVKGAVKFAENIDNEKSLADVAQTVGIAYGGYVLAGVEKAKDAGDAAVAINASKQATSQAGIAAEVTKAGIVAETVKVITIPK